VNRLIQIKRFSIAGIGARPNSRMKD